MNTNTSVERLLPSLYAFLSADPTPSPLTGASSPTTSLSAPQSPTSPSTAGCYESLAQVQTITESYARWRRCIVVWRRVIGNDILFLTLLLHAGCLWSPDYAAIHTEKLEIMSKSRGHLHRKTSSATSSSPISSPTDGNTVGRRKTRRGAHASAEVAALATQAAQAEAAASHERLVDACPASMWALHVLHFLCIEEIYAVPPVQQSGCTSAVNENVKEDGDDSSRSEDSGSDENSTSRSESSSDGDNEGSSDVDRSVDANNVKREQKALEEGNIVDVADGTSRTRKASDRCGKRRRSRTTDNNKQGRRRVRFAGALKVSLDPTSPTSPASSSASARQLAASSSLLPKLNTKHRSSKKELQNYLDVSLAALRQEQAEREGRRRVVASVKEVHPQLDKNNGDSNEEEQKTDIVNANVEKSTATTDVGGASGWPPARAQALLLRATVSLVSEEEPLVQQVAAALVEDWLDLLTPSSSFSSIPIAYTMAVENEGLKNALKGSVKGYDAASGKRTTRWNNSFPSSSDTSRVTPCTTNSSTENSNNKSHEMCEDVALLAQEQQREARHYWLSCLMKLVSFLDGVHSALREENLHLSAVMARQGIAPHNAEDIFTKSLPAIFNCVLVEEVLQMASYTYPSLSLLTSSSTSYAAPKLWMPPPVLLLPFHFLAQGSQVGVWVPAVGTPDEALNIKSSTASFLSSSSSSTSRTQGRFVVYVVDSYGLHLSTSYTTSTEAQGETSVSASRSSKSYGTDIANAVKSERNVMTLLRSRFTFGLRSVEPETLLDQRCRPWVKTLLPLCHSSFPHLSHDTSTRPSFAAAFKAGFSQREDVDVSSQSPLRSWACTQAATAGCPRVDLYVARTLVMLPIPAQSTSDSTSNRTDAARATSRASGSSSNAAAAAAAAVSAVEKAAANDTANKTITSRTRRDNAHGYFKRVALSPDEVAVRRRHPQLFHAFQSYLHNSKAAAFTPPGGGMNSDPTQLILLYGLARGEEAAALRHMGFSVRTGSHHGLGRGGGAAGGMATSESNATSPPSSLLNSLSYGTSSSSSSSGRLTLARDALGTTLEGLYLIARRVLSLRGLYTTADVAASSGDGGGERGKGALHYRDEVLLRHIASPNDDRRQTSGKDDDMAVGKGGFTGDKGDVRFHAKGSIANSNEERRSPNTLEATTANIRGSFTGNGMTRCVSVPSLAQEGEVLGTTAATLVLTALLLSHNLMDELIEQPSLVLWTTELASYIVDVSLLMPRPIPRLLKASGFALALLLQPAQSLLVMVGLVSTLISREIQHSETKSAATTMPWHPWWTLFRSTVLRDTTLPSCLYGGVWALVEKAEDAMALAAAQARWETSGPLRAATGRRRNMETGKDETMNNNDSGSSGRVFGESGGGHSGNEINKMSAAHRGVWKTERPVLRLMKSTASNTASTSSASGNAVDGRLGIEANDYATTGSTSSTVAVAHSTSARPHHRLSLLSHPSTSTASSIASSVASTSRQCLSAASANNSTAPLWMCGPAVLNQKPLSQDSADGIPVVSSLARVITQLRVVSSAEMAFPMEGSPWTTKQRSLTSSVTQHLGQRKPVLRWPLFSSSSSSVQKSSQSAAAASALWLSLEATCLQWPSTTTGP